MSYHISTPVTVPRPASHSSRSVSSDDGSEDCFSDWASDMGDALVTRSLFDHSEHATPELAVEHDKRSHSVALQEIQSKLGLDVYGTMRLVNLVRKERLSPQQVNALQESDLRLEDDLYLVPVIPDDPLLQLSLEESWSDDDGPPQAGPSSVFSPPTETDRLQQLQAELDKTKADLQKLQSLLQTTLDDDHDTSQNLSTGAASTSIKVSGKNKGKVALGRDDDTHYFDSYAENDIHEIMLKDTTRTLSYARFILSNPQVFNGAIVMDVGCGTGILSMFAAKAGAKKVFAIEASGLASKARENIRRNGLEDVITVIQGKVEDIELPVKQVDVIISEWMGYMLLYESMLDSVLHARDCFLAPSGLMAPSQTRLVISGITGEQAWKDRVDFWQDVYGFNMTAMDNVYFDEGLVEVVDEKEVVTDDCVVRDINTHSATPKSLDFHSSFTLRITSATTIRAFLTHFDTFFSPHPGATASHVPLDHDVAIIQRKPDDHLGPVESVSAPSSGTDVSFTTGPRGVETHWRQVVFLLRQGLAVEHGDRVEGQFFCRKSADNSRELDVEIHYGLARGEEKAAGFTVQTYKVR